jgi:hypothetical protein
VRSRAARVRAVVGRVWDWETARRRVCDILEAAGSVVVVKRGAWEAKSGMVLKWGNCGVLIIFGGSRP